MRDTMQYDASVEFWHTSSMHLIDSSDTSSLRITSDKNVHFQHQHNDTVVFSTTFTLPDTVFTKLMSLVCMKDPTGTYMIFSLEDFYTRYADRRPHANYSVHNTIRMTIEGRVKEIGEAGDLPQLLRDIHAVLDEIMNEGRKQEWDTFHKP
jgi:hypothetical protein